MEVKMKIITYSHNYGEEIVSHNSEFQQSWFEIKHALDSISEKELAAYFNGLGDKRGKSLSRAINDLLYNKFVELGWHPESPIFNDNRYDGKSHWRLDFAKDTLSVEVGFNHSGSIAWNLLKPVLASELNHVEKAIQTKIGIIITATDELRDAGGFDGAIGTFSQYVRYLLPLSGKLTTPLIIIGIKAPESFKITQKKNPLRNRWEGYIEYL